VLNEMHGVLQRQVARYWRDKRGHEVDFVLVRRGASPLAIECKWSADEWGAAGLKAFRHQYPGGVNVVVARDVERAFTRHAGDLVVRFMGMADLPSLVQGAHWGEQA